MCHLRLCFPVDFLSGNLSVDVCGVLKSPTIIVFLAISPFMTVSVCFIYLGAPILRAYIYFFNLFIYYFWLCWVFVSVHGLSLVAASGGATLRRSVRASHCGGLSCCGARAVEHTGFSRCSTLAQ